MLIDIVTVGGAVGIAWLLFFLKRQMGISILLVMSGSLLASTVGQSLTTWLSSHGFATNLNSPEAVVNLALILLPLFVALMKLPKDKLKPRRLAGAVVLGAVIITVTSNDLLALIPSQSSTHSQQLQTQVGTWQGWIMAVGIGYALFMLYFGKNKEKEDGKKK
jgi:hypothetical protein